MKDAKPFDVLPFGWMELDGAGTVTEYSPALEERAAGNQAFNLVGCNLFTDVAPIARVKEFHDRFQVFLQSPFPTELFNLTFNDSDSSVHTRIMLSQINEHQQPSGRKQVLVRVTKV